MATTAKIAKEATTLKYKIRHRNRCQRCGRPRGYLRKFALCRLCFRELALRGEVAGVIKGLLYRERRRGLSNGERKMLHSAKQILLSELVLAEDSGYEELEKRVARLEAENRITKEELRRADRRQREAEERANRSWLDIFEYGGIFDR